MAALGVVAGSILRAWEPYLRGRRRQCGREDVTWPGRHPRGFIRAWSLSVVLEGFRDAAVGVFVDLLRRLVAVVALHLAPCAWTTGELAEPSLRRASEPCLRLGARPPRFFVDGEASWSSAKELRRQAAFKGDASDSE